MARHREHSFKQVPYLNEYECEKDCPEHGPFPTKWGRPTMVGGYEDCAVRWERYCAPYTLEYRDVKVVPPHA